MLPIKTASPLAFSILSICGLGACLRTSATVLLVRRFGPSCCLHSGLTCELRPFHDSTGRIPRTPSSCAGRLLMKADAPLTPRLPGDGL